MIAVLLRRAASSVAAGSAIAEMVVVAPLLLLLLIGLIEVGRMGDYTVRVSNAARAGVQYGAQSQGASGDTTGMQNAATNDGQNGVTAVASTFCQCEDGTASTCAATDCSTSHRIQWVQVIATATYTSLLNYPYFPASLRSIRIDRKAVMRVTQ